MHGLHEKCTEINDSYELLQTNIEAEFNEKIKNGYDFIDQTLEKQSEELNSTYEEIKLKLNENLNSMTEKINMLSNQCIRIDREIEEKVKTQTESMIEENNQRIEELYKTTEETISKFKTSKTNDFLDFTQELEDFIQSSKAQMNAFNEKYHAHQNALIDESKKTRENMYNDFNNSIAEIN